MTGQHRGHLHLKQVVALQQAGTIDEALRSIRGRRISCPPARAHRSRQFQSIASAWALSSTNTASSRA
jgi:hypothetical protein